MEKFLAVSRRRASAEAPKPVAPWERRAEREHDDAAAATGWKASIALATLAGDDPVPHALAAPWARWLRMRRWRSPTPRASRRWKRRCSWRASALGRRVTS